ncbi:bestrophin family protein [Acidisphaera sp. L21]|uniref:bestrophin family protein n=1 Tax=Acidisphaera sp. L21 TaxID=1641851 RepID=UPI00131B5C7A|nr:bestrophin family ion channel [Acidisphaera sp. L21]
MIVRRGLDLPRLVRHGGLPLLALLAYDVLVTLIYMVGNWTWISVPELPLPLLGSAIALIVTLRNNAGYNRWWEARGLWGAVVNNSRSLARGLATFLEDPLLAASLVRHQIAYALALRCHLLRLPPWDDLAAYLPPETIARLREVANVPFAIQMIIGRHIAEARRAGSLDAIGATALDRTLNDIANAQGGLERIKNTPMPRQYDQFPQVFTRVYCLLLPIGLVNQLGYYTPVGSTVIGFMFIALDRIGQDLEDPFENRIHDLPMQAITRGIEIDLLQASGATGVPSPVTPVDGILG